MEGRLQLTKFHGGRVIWVYKHLRTHQVVYSLRQSLRGHGHRLAMDQLPFLGKKTKPAAIRGDMWRPYCRIEFSPGKEWLGLLTYRKLRECNTLRYTSWNRKGQSMPGNREERAFDLMDQRATSVADIAKVLEESRGWASREVKVEEARNRQTNVRLEALWSRMQKCIDPMGREATLAQVEEKLRLLNNQLTQPGNSQDVVGRLQQELLTLKSQRNFYTRTTAAMEAIKGEELSSEQWRDLPRDFKLIVEQRKRRSGATSNLEELGGVVEEPVENSEAGVQAKSTNMWDSLTKGFSGILTRNGGQQTPSDGDNLDGGQETSSYRDKPSRDGRALPYQESALTHTSSHSLGSIRIGWDDLRDAQWAASWPQTVLHEPLGFLVQRGSSRLFPPLTARPITDLTPEEELIMDETKLDGEINEEDGADETEAPTKETGEHSEGTTEDLNEKVKGIIGGDQRPERVANDKLATDVALPPSRLAWANSDIKLGVPLEGKDEREKTGALLKGMSSLERAKVETADKERAGNVARGITIEARKKAREEEERWARQEKKRVKAELGRRSMLEDAEKDLAKRTAQRVRLAREEAENPKQSAVSPEERRLMLIKAKIERVGKLAARIIQPWPGWLDEKQRTRDYERELTHLAKMRVASEEERRSRAETWERKLAKKEARRIELVARARLNLRNKQKFEAEEWRREAEESIEAKQEIRSAKMQEQRQDILRNKPNLEDLTQGRVSQVFRVRARMMHRQFNPTDIDLAAVPGASSQGAETTA